MSIGDILLNYFYEYYKNLLKQLEKAFQFSLEGTQENEEVAIYGIVQNIQSVLRKEIEEQIEKINETTSSDEQELLKKGLYIQVALTDELFLRNEWVGQSRWQKKMFEHQIFKTQCAGERIYQDIENILYKSNKTNKELIGLYLLILSLGFKGEKNQINLDKYKRKLFHMLYPNKDSLFLDPKRFLMPQVFMHNINENKQRKFLQDIRFWRSLLIVTLFFYIATTTLFWYSTQAEVAKITRPLLNRLRVDQLK